MKRAGTRRRILTADLAREIAKRDLWSCVCCGVGVQGDRGVSWSIHHRIPRGMGGTTDPRLNSPANLVLLCGSGTTGCHGSVEHYRDKARERGLLLWRSQDPETVPVEVCVQMAGGLMELETRPYLLDDIGGRVEVRRGV